MPSPFDSTEAADDPIENQPGSIEDTPPKSARARSRASSKAEPKRATPRAKVLTIDQLSEEVTGVVQKLGAGIYMFGVAKQLPKPQYDGAVLAENAERVGKAVGQAAEKSPKFKKALEGLVAATGLGILGGVLASVALPIAWNHGLVPNVFAGFIDHPEATPYVAATAPDSANGTAPIDATAHPVS
jgi:hypothetical protein